MLPPSSSALLAPLPQSSSQASASQRFFIPSTVEPHVFHPHGSLSVAARATVQSAGVGLLVSSVQNALDKHDRGAMGIFTRTGGTIGFFAALGFTYAFTKSAVANIRETDDAMNGVAGGCAAGFIAGVRARSLPIAFASCAAMGTLIGTFDAAGAKLTGTERQALSRPEREERRLAFFKAPKEEVAAQ